LVFFFITVITTKPNSKWIIFFFGLVVFYKLNFQKFSLFLKKIFFVLQLGIEAFDFDSVLVIKYFIYFKN